MPYFCVCIIEWKNMLPHIIKLLYIFPSLFFRIPFLSHTHVVGRRKQRNRAKIYGLPFAVVWHWHRKQKFKEHFPLLSSLKAAKSFYLNFKCAKTDAKMKYLRKYRFSSKPIRHRSLVCVSRLNVNDTLSLNNVEKCKYDFIVFNSIFPTQNQHI